MIRILNFFKKKHKEPECQHIWHDVGKYRKPLYGDHLMDSQSKDCYVLYCEKCNKQREFLDESLKDIQLTVSKIRENSSRAKLENEE